jgi:hypothetical protein
MATLAAMRFGEYGLGLRGAHRNYSSSNFTTQELFDIINNSMFVSTELGNSRWFNSNSKESQNYLIPVLGFLHGKALV